MICKNLVTVLSIMQEKKVIFLGNSSVGKTSIINKLLTGDFDENVTPTIGVAFTSQRYENQKHNVCITYWDTAGQEQYRNIVPMFYRGSNIAVIVFDVSIETDFADCDYWINGIYEHCDSKPEIIIVGNKIDLPRVVTFTQGTDYAMENNATYVEVSAKTGENMDMLLDTLIDVSSHQNTPTEVQPAAPQPVSNNSNQCC